MSERSRHTTAVFLHPAMVVGIEGILAAGTYRVETVEEQILGLSFIAYRRLQTTIEIPSKSGALNGRQVVAVEPEALQAALERDAEAELMRSAP
jgi:hypothetical protein